MPIYQFLSPRFIVFALAVTFAMAGCQSKESASEKTSGSAPTTNTAVAVSTPAPAPTPAQAGMGKVTITWGTESEQECYGFNVFRSRSADGPFEKANKKLIRGAGTTHVPQRYQVVDQPLPMGETFYYKVQQIDLSGEKRDITPVMSCKVTQPADSATEIPAN